MSDPVKIVPVTGSTERSANPFDAGQAIVSSVAEQVSAQAGQVEALMVIQGIFSGAMCVLLAAWGHEAVDKWFHQLLDATRGTRDPAAHQELH